jgi:hypothetical protein
VAFIPYVGTGTVRAGDFLNSAQNADGMSYSPEVCVL